MAYQYGAGSPGGVQGPGSPYQYGTDPYGGVRVSQVSGGPWGQPHANVRASTQSAFSMDGQAKVVPQSTYTFQERRGKIEIARLAAVDIERVIRMRDIDTLQVCVHDQSARQTRIAGGMVASHVFVCCPGQSATHHFREADQARPALILGGATHQAVRTRAAYHGVLAIRASYTREQRVCAARAMRDVATVRGVDTVCVCVHVCVCVYV